MKGRCLRAGLVKGSPEIPVVIAVGAERERLWARASSSPGVIAIGDERECHQTRALSILIEGSPEIPVVLAVGDRGYVFGHRPQRGISRDPSGNCGRR
jgi:hypothetical protein